MPRPTFRVHAKFKASLPPLTQTERRIIPFRPLYSGGECDVDGFDYPTVVDIDSLVIEDDCPALIQHDPAMVVGKHRNICKKNTNGLLSVDSDADVHGTVYAKALLEYIDEDIHKPEPSIGVDRIRSYNTIFHPAGTTAQVNGRTFQGPIYVIYQGHMTEGSFVTLRGDYGAKSLLASLKLFNKGEKVMTFEEFLASKNITQEQFDAMTPEEQAALKAEFEADGSGGEVDASLDEGGEPVPGPWFRPREGPRRSGAPRRPIPRPTRFRHPSGKSVRLATFGD